MNFNKKNDNQELPAVNFNKVPKNPSQQKSKFLELVISKHRSEFCQSFGMKLHIFGLKTQLNLISLFVQIQ